MAAAKALLDKFAAGQTTFGILELTPSPELVELCGYVGFDYVMIDRMVTSIDWGTAAEMVRAADASGIASIIRAEADPWRPNGNSGLATELTRAISIGADGICMSVAGVEDVDTALEIGTDWHRRIYVTRFDSPETFRAEKERVVRETIVMPLVESHGAIDQIEAIMARKPTAIFLGMGDLAQLMGQDEAGTAKLWDFVAKTGELAAANGVVLVANTGATNRTTEKILDRAKRLLDLGVTSLVLQWTTQLLQNHCEDLLGRVRELG